LDSLTHPGAIRNEVAKADILLVTIGANDLIPLQTGDIRDCARTCYLSVVNGVGHNVERIVAAARSARPSAPPTVLVTNYWNVFQDGDVGTAIKGQAFEQWSDTLTREEDSRICDGAERAGATCVDLYAPFKGDGSKNPTSLLAADGDHPNEAGHQLIASALLAETPELIP
jgi:lysophospholipase L1-like esterase